MYPGSGSRGEETREPGREGRVAAGDPGELRG